MIRKSASKIGKSTTVSKDKDNDNEHEETHATVDAVTMDPSSMNRSAYDKICLSLGLFYLFLILAGSLYVAFMVGSTLDIADNDQWGISFVIALLLDILIIENVSIVIGAMITQ